MLRRTEESKIDSISSTLFIASSILLSLLIGIVFFTDASASFVYSMFFMVLSIELLFFTLNTERWYKVTFYNFSKLFFFLSIFIIFLGLFETVSGRFGLLPIFNDILFCLTYTVGIIYSGAIAVGIFLSFLFLYMGRNVFNVFRAILDAFSEKFWLKIILISALTMLILIVFKSEVYMGCLNMGSVICDANWLEQEEMDSSELCRTTCYDKYNVLSYEIREGICYCDVNDCKS